MLIFENKKKSTISLWFLTTITSVFCGQIFAQSVTYNIDYSQEINPNDLFAYDLSIISPDANVDIKKAQSAGKRILGYFSIGEYASDANYVNRIEELKLNALGKNDNWNSYITDLTDSRWRTFILDELVGKVAEKGFDGFFIDTMESGELLIDKMPDKVDDWFDGLVRVIIEIRKRYPRKQIIVNRGFRALDELKDTIDGVLLESLYQTHDYQSGEYHAVDSGTTAINVNRLKRLKSLGLDINIQGGEQWYGSGFALSAALTLVPAMYFVNIHLDRLLYRTLVGIPIKGISD